MSEIRANTVSNAAGTGPVTLTGQYAAKAWMNFNGTGTVAINASGNVSSLTDNGTGDYTVNFSTAMADANYALTTSGTLRGDTSSSNAVLQIQNIAGGAPTTPALMSSTQIRIAVKSSVTSGGWDAPTLCINVTR